MNWIFFGFKNCGKTTLAKRIAKTLHRPFVDTDRCVEQLHYAQTGVQRTCRQIFSLIGQEEFRKLETQVLEELKTAQNTLIALGGGYILDPNRASALAELGQLVYLKASKSTLKHRTLRGKPPAFLDPLDLEGSFEAVYEERLPLYEKICALAIDLNNKTQHQIVQELCALIAKVEATHGK